MVTGYHLPGFCPLVWFLHIHEPWCANVRSSLHVPCTRTLSRPIEFELLRSFHFFPGTARLWKHVFCAPRLCHGTDRCFPSDLAHCGRRDHLLTPFFPSSCQHCVTSCSDVTANWKCHLDSLHTL